MPEIMYANVYSKLDILHRYGTSRGVHIYKYNTPQHLQLTYRVQFSYTIVGKQYKKNFINMLNAAY